MVGPFDPDYPRHQIIRTGLERIGVDVHSVILPRHENTAHTVVRLFQRWHEMRNCDVILVPAFCQLLAPFVWMLGHALRKPVLLDYMVGLTDGIVEERGQRSSLSAFIFRLIDQFNLSRMTSMTDTMAHIRHFQRLLGRKPQKMVVVPVGVYDPWFHPQPPVEASTLLVQFFGSYIPFHGVEILLEAISRFGDDPRVRFELIGRGQTYQACRQRAEALNLSNVTFADPIPPSELPARVAQAAICLGVFGSRPKTDYVVPNKVYQCMALGRPVITADSAALREFFTPGEHLITVPPGDPQALAEAIRRLLDSPAERARLGTAAANQIREASLPEHIGQRVRSTIEQQFHR